MSEDTLADAVWGTWGASKDLRHEFAWQWMCWNLARQIKAMRTAKGWSQDELARRTGLTQQTICRYENTCRQATIRGLKAIAAAFDVALICRFAAFSEVLVIMGNGSVLVPRGFDEDLVAMREGREP